MEYGAQIKSVSDVKVDSILKSIWSKVAITTSYHKCYHKWALVLLNQVLSQLRSCRSRESPNTTISHQWSARYVLLGQKALLGVVTKLCKAHMATVIYVYMMCIWCIHKNITYSVSCIATGCNAKKASFKKTPRLPPYIYIMAFCEQPRLLYASVGFNAWPRTITPRLLRHSCCMHQHGSNAQLRAITPHLPRHSCCMHQHGSNAQLGAITPQLPRHGCCMHRYGSNAWPRTITPRLLRHGCCMHQHGSNAQLRAITPRLPRHSCCIHQHGSNAQLHTARNNKQKAQQNDTMLNL